MSKIHDAIKAKIRHEFQCLDEAAHHSVVIAPSYFWENFIRVWRGGRMEERWVREREWSCRVRKLRRNIWSIKWDGNWINCENALKDIFTHKVDEEKMDVVRLQPLSSLHCITLSMFFSLSSCRHRWWQTFTCCHTFPCIHTRITIDDVRACRKWSLKIWQQFRLIYLWENCIKSSLLRATR